MENEERRRPKRKRRNNTGMTILVIVLAVIAIGELVLLIKQKGQNAEPGSVNEQLTEAQQEVEELRAQAENYKDERDAYLEQLNQLGAGADAMPTGATGTVEIPTTDVPDGSGEVVTDPQPGEGDPVGDPVENPEVGTGEPDEGGNEPENTGKGGYEIITDVRRIYLDQRYQEFTKENDPYDTKQYTYSTMYSYPTDVVFLGDSLTERCTWNELFPGLNVKNRGIGGDTVNGILVRLDTVMKTQPKKIFLMVGINNLMNGNSADQTIEDYGVLLDKLVKLQDEEGFKLYVESILPVGPEIKNASGIIMDGRKINAAVKDMCSERGITYIDLTDAFSNEDLGLNSEYNYDGVHINAKGYRVLRDILDEYVYEGFDVE